MQHWKLKLVSHEEVRELQVGSGRGRNQSLVLLSCGTSKLAASKSLLFSRALPEAVSCWDLPSAKGDF